MDIALRQLIEDYLWSVDTACDLLRQRLNIEGNILHAWQSSKVPQTGWLDEQHQISFYFHGIGCCVEHLSECVDFDFGPEGRQDGFDAWRLSRFAESIDSQEPLFRDHNALTAELKRLHANGEIIRLTKGLGGHLFYFPQTLERDSPYG
jgi:hypothetical protein